MLDIKQEIIEPHAVSMTPSAIHQISAHSEMRPHVCEMPDCSAVSLLLAGYLNSPKNDLNIHYDNQQSFTSRAALHGHTRIHCIGRNNMHLNNNSNNTNGNHQISGGSGGVGGGGGGGGNSMSNGGHNNGNMNSGPLTNGHCGSSTSQMTGSSHGLTAKDDFPCKVCGK